MGQYVQLKLASYGVFFRDTMYRISLHELSIPSYFYGTLGCAKKIVKEYFCCHPSDKSYIVNNRSLPRKAVTLLTTTHGLVTTL